MINKNENEVFPMYNDPHIKNSFDSISDYVQSLETVDHFSDGNAKPEAEVLGKKDVVTSSVSTRHVTPTRVHHDNYPSKNLKRKAPYSFSIGIDLHERYTLQKTDSALARLDIICAVYFHAKQVNALAFPRVLNFQSQRFLSSSVRPVLGCLMYHYNLDVTRFLDIQDHALAYYGFRYTRCRGKPGKCTLLESMNKKKARLIREA